jgi:hypothetical protein
MTKQLLLCFILFLSTNVPTSNSSTQVFSPTEDVYEYQKQWKYILNKSFLCKLAQIESGNRYDVVNSYGYMGAYQFSLSTLRLIGINTTRSEFLANPDLQDEAAIRLMEANKIALQRYIDRYRGTYVHGYYITESGLLAAAHLVGVSPVIRFLNTGQVKSDGYGTTLTRYIRIFKNYTVYV